MRKKLLSLEEKFWRKVVKVPGGCWIFNDSPETYGQISHQKRTHLAHRLSYEMHKGEIPRGLYVCHNCDVRGCVNPGHLYAGTHEDNKRDAVNRGRLKGARGKCHNATPEKIRELIREEYAEGKLTQVELAEKYGKTQGTVSQIVRNYPRKTNSNGGKTRSGFFRRKMDPSVYLEIQAAYLSGSATQVQLAERYNCTQTHISRIVHKQIQEN